MTRKELIENTVDVFLDHLFIGSMTFRKWDDPGKALSTAKRYFPILIDMENQKISLKAECKEKEKIVHIHSQELFN